MNEKMDFFEAARQSERNGSRIRFKAEEWRHWHDYFARGNIFLPEQLLEKAWQVEPEPEQLFDFAIAFAAARRGDLIEMEGGENWSKYQAQHDADGNGGCAVLIDQNGVEWWPDENQTAVKWRIKPKEEPEKEIFVWGACDIDGGCWIFSEKPKLKSNSKWNADESGLEWYVGKNLFPKDKPIKFKLELVEDNE